MKYFPLLILLLVISAGAQIPSITPANIPNTANPKNDAHLTADESGERELKILDEAGRYFKQALFHLQDDRRGEAREDFDKSVDVFLMSGLDVQRVQTLRECYSQLIETIYRIEFPKNQLPQIRSLSGTCRWNIDSKLADQLVKQTQAKQSNQSPESQAPPVDSSSPSKDSDYEGFANQKFSTSPTDQLKQLNLDKIPETGNVIIFRAQTGDTVETLSKRHGLNSVEVAKFNGLFINSKLGTGREIRFPKKDSDLYSYKSQAKSIDLSGAPPAQLKNGTVPAVVNWFNEYANDPYSLKILRWGKVRETYSNGYKIWAVCVKFRAKNAFNAYILSSMDFYFGKGKVIAASQITDCQN